MSAIKCARNVLIFSILFVTDLHFLEKEVKAFLQLPQIEEVLKGHLLSIYAKYVCCSWLSRYYVHCQHVAIDKQLETANPNSTPWQAVLSEQLEEQSLIPAHAGS